MDYSTRGVVFLRASWNWRGGCRKLAFFQQKGVCLVGDVHVKLRKHLFVQATFPICAACMEYLPTFTIDSEPNVGTCSLNIQFP